MHDICPSADKDRHIYLRVLHDACVKLGGEHQLALYLGVSVRDVDDWLTAKALPPDQVFLRCLDIVQDAPKRPL